MSGIEKKKGSSAPGKVLFLGNRNDVDRLYQAMDVFVLPSRYEGLPVVGVEAQAAGLPCVLSDQVTREIKMTKQVVFVGLECDPQKWAEIIQKREEPYRAGQAAIMDSAGFSIKTQCKRMTDFYEEILTRKKEGSRYAENISKRKRTHKRHPQKI